MDLFGIHPITQIKCSEFPFGKWWFVSRPSYDFWSHSSPGDMNKTWWNLVLFPGIFTPVSTLSLPLKEGALNHGTYRWNWGIGYASIFGETSSSPSHPWLSVICLRCNSTQRLSPDPKWPTAFHFPSQWSNRTRNTVPGPRNRDASTASATACRGSSSAALQRPWLVWRHAARRQRCRRSWALATSSSGGAKPWDMQDMQYGWR